MGQESDWMRGVGIQHSNQSLRTASMANASKQEPNSIEDTSINKTGVELTISKFTPEELNKGILQAKQEYALAQVRGDQKGMALAAQKTDNLLVLSGTVHGIIESPADRGTAWRNPRDGSVVVTTGEDAGEVVISPTRPNVELQNSLAENAKVKYFRAQILGDKQTMEEAVREGEQARAKGATLRADQDTALTRSLKHYVNQVEVIKTGIHSRNTQDLNKGIVQLKNDYLYAKNTNDPVGTEAARIMGDVLRKLGGTIGAGVSLEDAKKMIESKPAPTPVPTSTPIDTSPKSGEIFDRVLGFVTGAGVATGENLLSMIQANADPLGTAIESIHNFVVGLPKVYKAAVDWEKTVAEIDTLLSQFREYYRTAPAYERGKLEGRLLVDTLGGVFAGRKVVIVNGKLANSFHPVSGVPFDVDGFPIFDAKFEAKIETDLFTASNSTHFSKANEQLLEAIRRDPSLAAQFTDEDIKRLEKKLNPKGYTWHHHQEPGRLQLVDSDLHEKTGHTGGRALWGKE